MSMEYVMMFDFVINKLSNGVLNIEIKLFFEFESSLSQKVILSIFSVNLFLKY